jgi:hypothetical protein
MGSGAHTFYLPCWATCTHVIGFWSRMNRIVLPSVEVYLNAAALAAS